MIPETLQDELTNGIPFSISVFLNNENISFAFILKTGKNDDDDDAHVFPDSNKPFDYFFDVPQCETYSQLKDTILKCHHLFASVIHHKLVTHIYKNYKEFFMELWLSDDIDLDLIKVCTLTSNDVRYLTESFDKETLKLCEIGIEKTFKENDKVLWDTENITYFAEKISTLEISQEHIPILENICLRLINHDLNLFLIAIGSRSLSNDFFAKVCKTCKGSALSYVLNSSEYTLTSIDLCYVMTGTISCELQDYFLNLIPTLQDNDIASLILTAVEYPDAKLLEFILESVASIGSKIDFGKTFSVKYPSKKISDGVRIRLISSLLFEVVQCDNMFNLMIKHGATMDRGFIANFFIHITSFSHTAWKTISKNIIKYSDDNDGLWISYLEEYFDSQIKTIVTTSASVNIIKPVIDMFEYFKIKQFLSGEYVFNSSESGEHFFCLRAK
jgi:hypothetical protein